MSRHRRRHWPLLWRALGRRRPALVGLAAWSVVEAVPALLAGRLVAAAVDDGFLAGRAGAGFCALGLMALTVAIGALGTRQTFSRVAAVVEPVRDELVDLVVTGAMRRSTGPGQPPDTGAVARLTHQVEIVREALASVVVVVLTFVVSVVAAVVGLSALAPVTLAFVLPPVVVGLVVFLASLPSMAAGQRRVIVADERIAETVGTLASGLRDVVGCGGEEPIRAGAERTIAAQQDASAGLARLVAVRTAALNVASWAPVLLLLLGTPRLLAHGATAGTVLGALTYVSLGLQPALQTFVRTVGGTGLWLSVTLERLVEAAEPPASAGAGPVATSSRAVSGSLRAAAAAEHTVVELRRVSFRYSGRAEPVVRELDLTFDEHDHLAVVGPSGVGKSTLAGLVAGLLEPSAGRALLNGVPLRHWSSAELTTRRVLIPQQAYVVTGTVGQNLRYYRADATAAELDHAVAAVGAAALIERLGGYREQVRPCELSAGERQLLTLARAYLAPARLVILDEATCHLDPAAEARVEAAFRDRSGGLLVIAHRISSALRADRVLVLDGDRAVVGEHHELLMSSALYRDLVGHWASPADPGPAAVARCPLHAGAPMLTTTAGERTGL